MAILHGEDRLSRLEKVSDIDLVSDRSAIEAVHAASPFWADIGLYPIIFWPYDVGGTATVFLATSGAEEGVQLDILHDVEGRGQYGFRSAALLDYAVPGQDLPRLDPPATQTYMARKRQVKGESHEYRTIMSQGDSALHRTAQHVLTPEAARQLLTGEHVRLSRHTVARTKRLLQRLARPVGAWVNVTCHNVEDANRIASTLGHRLQRILPHVTMSEFPSPARFVGWWVREVAPIRWRAGVSFSWSTASTRGPDISITRPTDLDEAARRMVTGLQHRILR